MIRKLGPLWADIDKIVVYDHERTNGSSVTIWPQGSAPIVLEGVERAEFLRELKAAVAEMREGA